MTGFVQIILALVWLLGVPTGCGMLIMNKKNNPYGLGAGLFWGYGLLFAGGELLFLAAIALKVPLSLLAGLWAFLSGGGALLGYVRAILQKGRRGRRFSKRTWEQPSYELWLALILIAVQVLAPVFFTHMDADDAFYVGTAVTACQTDTIFQINPYTGAPYTSLPSRYVLSPFPIFLAVISRLCLGLSPVVLAHTVVPLIWIPLAYVVYDLLGKSLFGGETRARSVFLLFMAVIQMSSYFSVYTPGTFLLVRIWQGKAVLASILLPGLLWLCLEVFDKKSKISIWYIGILMLACCFVSSMGIMMAPILLGCFLLIYGFFGRNWGWLLKGGLCCLPNMLLGFVYLVIR